jgi:hypothetical protein
MKFPSYSVQAMTSAGAGVTLSDAIQHQAKLAVISSTDRCSKEANLNDVRRTARLRMPQLGPRELLLMNNTSLPLVKRSSGIDTTGGYRDDVERSGWGEKVELVRLWESVIKIKRPILSKGAEKIVGE